MLSIYNRSPRCYFATQVGRIKVVTLSREQRRGEEQRREDLFYSVISILVLHLYHAVCPCVACGDKVR
jgi:hypothetical protein